MTVLDLGSMDVNGTYKECFNCPAWTYLGLDLTPGKNVDIVLKDPYDWREIRSDSVDVLVSGQAFEHIEYFWITALEIARVLKPDGLCCIIAPSGGPEHRYPVDCWRFYPDGFAAIARFARLELLELSTQWADEPGCTDCSNNWHDTLMVARKTAISGYRGCLEKARRLIIHKLWLSEKAGLHS
ncbi:MAG: methyltransferase domain-containing protein [Pseudomonadota bacterium]